VGEALAGRAERLKGYTIALEVFDRPASFDPLVNPIVRMEAGRLRDRLHGYYKSTGRFDRIVIALPKGAYAPKINFRRESLEGPEERGTHISDIPRGVDATRLSAISHCRPEGTVSEEARDAFLRGLAAFWRYSRESCFEAQEYFFRAIKL